MALLLKSLPKLGIFSHYSFLPKDLSKGIILLGIETTNGASSGAPIFFQYMNRG